MTKRITKAGRCQRCGQHDKELCAIQLPNGLRQKWCQACVRWAVFEHPDPLSKPHPDDAALNEEKSDD